MTREEAGKKGWEKSKEYFSRKYQERITTYNANPKICYCGNIIEYKSRRNKYCSHSCSASITNLGILRNKRKHKAHKCLYCTNITYKPKFCSRICSIKKTQTDVIEKIENGDYDVSYSGNKILRKYLIDKRGWECQKCKLPTWMEQKIPLDIHHIDGDATNNRLDNLELLCKNCHGLTLNFGRRNTKSTRIWRYQSH